MSKPVNFRLDEIHVAILEKTVEKLKEEGVKTNKTDTVQKAIYSFGNIVLSNQEMKTIIDNYYQGPDIDWID
ncbi:hypothetical protein [Paraliobacillus sp. JSM ZJ581]|uniref:hypothetical protein n=1 Tax=Paraliobacillus sp. JSM ZJ581 TaxID=3342118 RepID=UPI0035A9AA91